MNEELLQIFDNELNDLDFVIEKEAKAMVKRFVELYPREQNFTNVGVVENLIEGLTLNQAGRAKFEDRLITKEDMKSYLFESEDKFKDKFEVKIGFNKNSCSSYNNFISQVIGEEDLSKNILYETSSEREEETCFSNLSNQMEQ